MEALEEKIRQMLEACAQGVTASATMRCRRHAREFTLTQAVFTVVRVSESSRKMDRMLCRRWNPPLTALAEFHQPGILLASVRR